MSTEMLSNPVRTKQDYPKNEGWQQSQPCCAASDYLKIKSAAICWISYECDDNIERYKLAQADRQCRN